MVIENLLIRFSLKEMILIIGEIFYNRPYELITNHSIDIYGLRAFLLELYKKSCYDKTYSGDLYVASGMNVSAYTNPDASQEDIQKMETENIKWKEIVENLPTVFEVIKNIHNS